MSSSSPDLHARRRDDEHHPSAGRVRWSRWLRWEINTQAGRWSSRPVPEQAAILVAGCGAEVAVEYARSFPAGDVLAVETSEGGARLTEKLAATLSRRNLYVERREVGWPRGIAPPGLPQIRACGTPAPGSSGSRIRCLTVDGVHHAGRR